MESYKEMVNNSRIILDDGNYGFWKARIRSMIKGIDPLAWKAVTDKWEEALVADANGVFHPKPEESWTEEELKRAKYNSRALTTIHTNVSRKTFELIQGVETAKEAWDILQMQYKETTKVQNSRKDMLASRFENLKMEEDETILEFSSKLSALAQEAAVLGKKYKDKKLVKKFLRCLPSRFMGYKSALSVSSNTENMPFSELVGMLKAHEMELDSLKKPKSLALKCENRITEDEEDDPISLLVQRFDRALRKTGKPQKKVASFKKTTEGDKPSRKSEVQCHECKGYGHFKNDCPTIKRREIQCYGCKGFGHTQLECVNDQNRRKDKSMLAEKESDDDSEDDSVEETNNFVIFIGIAEIEEGQESESEPEEEKEDDLMSSYKEVRHVLVSLNQENSELKKENQRLSVLVDKLSKDLEAANALGQGSVNLIMEKLELANKAEGLRQHLKVEKQITEKLESELDQLKKQIHMFAGTKQLDKILSYGCQGNTKHGLGYSGKEQKSSDEIKFVSSGYNRPEDQRPVTKLRKGREYYYCGKIGHIKAYCYSRWNRVQKLMKQRKFSWNGPTNQVWLRKEDLRFEPKGQQKKNSFKPREFTVKRSFRDDPMSMMWHGFKCNMAQVKSDEDESDPWYFDSGC
ncbi:paramyosin-like [Eutrema salsugineum]|uniref:paramyosin-like n=1 Tax=Eutrema salsugineum TaxID=72664 RepID=UPI000CED3E1F|nr:paramyosin-like [Eutrema salsugineum]